MKIQSLILAVFLLLQLDGHLHADATVPKVWCLVGSDSNRAAASELSAWRRSADGGAFAIREARNVADVGKDFDYLLILGNEDEMPPERMEFYRWMSSQKTHFASDVPWADWDGDGHPNAAVGRIPSSDPIQIRRVAEKIVRYEKIAPALGDLGLPVWMGSTAAGKLLDEAATFVMQRAMSWKGPEWADRWLVMGNPRDTFSAHGNRQDDLFNREISRGGAFSFFMGHGARSSFFSYETETQSFGYGVPSLQRIRGSVPSSPSVIFACDCGDYSNGKLSLAEAMLFAEGGPVAAIAATTQSHPLTNYYSGRCALEQLCLMHHRRLGDFWNAVQKAAFERRELWAEAVLSGVEGMLENKLNIGRLKHDHTMMYALAGDPATKLRLPEPLDVLWEKTADGSWRWEVQKSETEVGVSLVIGHRPVASGVVRSLPEGASSGESLHLFEARNHTLRYQETERRTSGAPWQGVIGEPGAWRIVKIGSSGLQVAAKVLR